jgi:hypothetical protein
MNGPRRDRPIRIAMRAADRSVQAAALLRQLIFPIGSVIIAAQVGQRRLILKNATVHD